VGVENLHDESGYSTHDRTHSKRPGRLNDKAGVSDVSNKPFPKGYLAEDGVEDIDDEQGNDQITVNWSIGLEVGEVGVDLGHSDTKQESANGGSDDEGPGEAFQGLVH